MADLVRDLTTVADEELGLFRMRVRGLMRNGVRRSDASLTAFRELVERQLGPRPSDTVELPSTNNNAPDARQSVGGTPQDLDSYDKPKATR